MIQEANEKNYLYSPDAIYEKFKIVASGPYAYTDSFFNNVYSKNLLLSGVIKEAVILKVYNYCKLNHVAEDTNGFVCIYKGSLFRYERQI